MAKVFACVPSMHRDRPCSPLFLADLPSMRADQFITAYGLSVRPLLSRGVECAARTVRWETGNSSIARFCEPVPLCDGGRVFLKGQSGHAPTNAAWHPRCISKW